jgi:hypothetical protein
VGFFFVDADDQGIFPVVDDRLGRAKSKKQKAKGKNKDSHGKTVLFSDVTGADGMKQM